MASVPQSVSLFIGTSHHLLCHVFLGPYNTTRLLFFRVNFFLEEEQEQLKQRFFRGLVLGQCLIPLIPQFSGMNVLSIHTTHAPAMPSSWVSSPYKNASIGGVMGLISWKFKN